MMPGVWWRSLGMIVCVAALISGGCAHWGWKHASRDNLNATLEDDEASFVQTSKPRSLASAHSKSTATSTAQGETAAKEPIRSAEEEALINDTLARLRTLPDMKPEQVDAIARDLRNPQQPMPRLALEQINAMAKFKQDEAQRAILQASASTVAPAQPSSTTPKATAPVAPPEKTATAESLINSSAPQESTSAAAAAKTPEAVEPVEPVAEEAAPAAAESSEPATVPAVRNLRDRMRRVRETKDESTAPQQGIFGGKVGAHEPPRLEPTTLAMAHTAQKPATELAASPNNAREPISWDESLTTTITALEEQLASDDLSGIEAEILAAKLRVLYLVANRKEDALSEIEGLDHASQDYWRHQLHSLSISLDRDGTPVKGRRAALALRPLREAVDHLAAQATLDVRNVVLCKNVSVWGTYTEFEDYTFKPNQEALLYFELENFTSEETAKGYATEFISSYEIFDTAGRRVAEQQFPVAQETCKNRRRDYFIRYHFHVPKTLAAGDYTLQLTVEDQKGHKFGQGSVKFKVNG